MRSAHLPIRAKILALILRLCSGNPCGFCVLLFREKTLQHHWARRETTKVLPSVMRSHTTTRCTHDKPLLNEVGFYDVFKRVPVFAQGRGKVFNAHGATVKLFDNRQ